MYRLTYKKENMENSKNFKLFRNFGTKFVSALLTGATVITFQACSSKETEKNKGLEQTDGIVQTTPSIQNEYSIEEEINGESELAKQFSEIFTSFKTSITSKFYLNDDDLKTSLTIMNIDYILVNNSDFITESYPNGLNSEKELTDFYTFISKYREYNSNLSDSKNFELISQYCFKEEDKKIISKLENLVMELIDLVNENKSENNERIQEIFDIINKFYDGEDITLEGEVVNKDDLSNGFNIASEVFGQIVSIYTKDIVDEKSREALDNKLRDKDRLSRIYILLEKYGNNNENIINTYIDGENSYILDESDKTVINEFESLVNSTRIALSKLDIELTDEQIRSLIVIRNCDYLASDYVSAGALKTIINNVEVEDIIKYATEAIELIEKHNNSRLDTKELYTYDITMNESIDEQKINNFAIYGALKLNFDLRNSLPSEYTESDISSNSNFIAIKLYNQYSNDMSFNIENYKIVKNDTGFGTRFITDAIYYNTLNSLNYQFDDINDLVDNTNEGMSSIDSISWAIEKKCSQYQYVK